MGGPARRTVAGVNRFIWMVRIFGILMLLGFLMMFAYMQRQYARMQGERPPAVQSP